MLYLSRSKWALFWCLFMTSTAVYAQQIHAFGEDFDSIEPRAWTIVGGTIIAGVLARFTVGNPDATLPKGFKGFFSTSILAFVAGLFVFWICEELRTNGAPMSDGVEIAVIFFAAYNHRRTVEWLNDKFLTRLSAAYDALIGKKSE